MRGIPEALLAGPFTLREAQALGVSEQMLRGRRFRTPYPCVRVATALGDGRDLLLRCAARAVPDVAAFSHETACEIWKLPLPLGWSPGAVQVAVPRGTTVPTVRGIRGRDALWLPGDVTTVEGLRVTSMPRAWCDLGATRWSALDLVALADAILRRGRSPSKAVLKRRLDAWEGHRGVRRLRGVLALAELRVDSPMETRLRLLLRTAGLPPATVNKPVHDGDGAWVHTPDLSWPQWKVALDYDGAHHFGESDHPDATRRARAVAAQLRRDAERREALQDEGWIFRTVSHEEVLTRPQVAVDRARAALVSAGATW